VGEVVESNLPTFKAGDFVTGFQGWREYYSSDGSDQRKIDVTGVSPSAYLGVLGMPGLTAYVGLLDIGEPKQGETVFVSGAAGAVGSLVGQIAKIKGCYVAGSAGSQAKVRHLIDDLGFDAAFDYKQGDLHAHLSRVCPKGIDVYFENVGGPMLEAVLTHMRPFGRIPVCGMIALYNATDPPPGPKSIIAMIPNRLKMQGFIVSDYTARMPDFIRDVGGWLQAGKIKYDETVIEGIEKAPQAFMGLFAGENTGKMVVKLA
jgi:NADPH-dependent curcumin reductase CurA